jgi:hypothetical protein
MGINGIEVSFLQHVNHSGISQEFWKETANSTKANKEVNRDKLVQQEHDLRTKCLWAPNVLPCMVKPKMQFTRHVRRL